ncbi:DEAD/DEAH box helicase [Peptococcus simiae]|uniref:DEAD/DEAH box helicase n=1 Tax=Peptococcus simiae TaxID=1643805 RepID=A0ABW9GX28_9FIRM
MSFNIEELSYPLKKAIDAMGFESLTPIQEKAIPVGLAGRDLIGQAQTGTGKTTAFAIPFLERIDDDDKVQVLVLTPTRELCIQVEKEIYKLSRYLPLHSLAIYGGQDIKRQISSLKNRPQIIVATPGRLKDHLRRRTIRLNDIKVVILDEADEMLNMGFVEDIEDILKECPEERQTMMFSATMRPEIKRIAETYMKDPEMVKVSQETLTVPAIDQEAFIVYEDKKLLLLTRLLDMMQPDLSMVFGRTKRRVDELTRALQQLGFRAEGLHGDLSQYQRDQVMRKFREKRIDILVATDVAARGLDVQGVTHVFNFDLPQDADSYVHRIGRTGRAGNDGLAMSFVTPREKDHLAYIERTIKHKIARSPLPTEQRTQQVRQENLRIQVVDALENGEFDQLSWVAEDLIATYGAQDALMAALSLITTGDQRDFEAKRINLTAEKPVYSKNSVPHKGGRGHKGSRNKNFHNRKNRSYNKGKHGDHGKGKSDKWKKSPRRKNAQ